MAIISDSVLPPSHGSVLLRSLRDATEPLAGSVASAIVTVLTATILACLTTQRILRVKSWRRLPPVAWIVFAIFIDSWSFVFVTAILKFGVGLSSSFGVCQGAILLCLVCYVTTKILIYIFLVEKAYIIRQSEDAKPRLKSKLYIFNSFVMLGLYVVVSVLNFIFRITRQRDGECIIGMQRVAMIPLVTFDFLVNVYLTMLFLLPLRKLYNFRHIQRTAANERLRNVAFRTFIGAVATTFSSIVNLVVLMALDGEPGWVCLMCCNLDIAFSAIVVHWVTSKDKIAVFAPSATSNYAKGAVTVYMDTEEASGGDSSSPTRHHHNHNHNHHNSQYGSPPMPNQYLNDSKPTFGTTLMNTAGTGPMSNEAIAMYHYHHHRHKNGGSSNRYPFTKHSSVSGGTFPGGIGVIGPVVVDPDFRKYGDVVSAMEDDSELERCESGCEGEAGDECEYELVLRKKKKRKGPATPTPQELDAVYRPGSRSRKWSVARETTLVVESTVVSDDELKRGLQSGGHRKVFGTRTVCSSANSVVEPSPRTAQGSGSFRRKNSSDKRVSLDIAGSILGRHSRNTSDESGTSKMSSSGLVGDKSETSWLSLQNGAGEDPLGVCGDDDFQMWDGTQGDRSARIEPEGRPSSSSSGKASISDLTHGCKLGG